MTSPQMPVSLQSLLQHVAGEVGQASPSAAHLRAPQTPSALQSLLQHMPGAAGQALPSGVQVGKASHVPPEQMELQHCEGVVHGWPLVVHVAVPQMPSALQSLLQHRAGAAGQVSPSVAQAGAFWQAPPVHMVLQHCEGVVQGWPTPVQVAGPHVPPLHWPSQQSLGAWHVAPTARQALPPQTPAVHSPPQQSFGAWHEAPFAWHRPPPSAMDDPPSSLRPPQAAKASAPERARSKRTARR
jgi:hypothetical protein